MHCRCNPDDEIRYLERQYQLEGTDEARNRLNVARSRAGLDLIPRIFEFGEGWQAQTTLPDGIIISSATASHDGWWGVDHLSWKTGDPASDKDSCSLGNHLISRAPPGVLITHTPKPTKEQVIESHREAVEKFRKDSVRFTPPEHVDSVIDKRGGFTTETRGKIVGYGTLWRRGDILRNGVSGILMRYERGSFYQKIEPVTRAYYKVPGYNKLVVIYCDELTGERID